MSRSRTYDRRKPLNYHSVVLKIRMCGALAADILLSPKRSDDPAQTAAGGVSSIWPHTAHQYSSIHMRARPHCRGWAHWFGAVQPAVPVWCVQPQERQPHTGPPGRALPLQRQTVWGVCRHPAHAAGQENGRHPAPSGALHQQQNHGGRWQGRLHVVEWLASKAPQQPPCASPHRRSNPACDHATLHTTNRMLKGCVCLCPHLQVFRGIPGLSHQVSALSPPLVEWQRFVYCESMVSGQLLGEVDHFPGEGQQRRQQQQQNQKHGCRRTADCPRHPPLSANCLHTLWDADHTPVASAHTLHPPSLVSCVQGAAVHVMPQCRLSQWPTCRSTGWRSCCCTGRSSWRQARMQAYTSTHRLTL